MKEFYERIPGDEVILSKKFCLRKFALMDVATNRDDVFVQNFGDLFNSIESEIDGHSSPKILFNWFRVSKLSDLIFPSTKREAQAGVLFAISAIFAWLKLLSMHQSINFFNSLTTSILFIALNNIIKLIKYVKHF